MSDAWLKTLAWLGVVVHLVVGVVARRLGDVRPVAAVNLVVALGVLAYWANEWYGYVTRGYSWSASDQLIPLYAFAVAVLAGLTFAGWRGAAVPDWIAFVVDGLVLLAAGLFAIFFRMKMF